MNTKTRIEKAIRAAIGASNLVTYAENIDKLNFLRVTVEGNDISVSLGNAPGNAYRAQPGEVFIRAGIEADGINDELKDLGFYFDEEAEDWEPGDGAEYQTLEEAEEAIDAEKTAAYIDKMMPLWIEEIERATSIS